MTHLYVLHTLYIYIYIYIFIYLRTHLNTIRSHTSDITYAYMCHCICELTNVTLWTRRKFRGDTHVTWLILMFPAAHSYIWHDVFLYVTWNPSPCWHAGNDKVIHMCRDSFSCVSWLILTRNIAHSCMWLDTRHLVDTQEVTRCYIRDMTHSHISRGSFLHMTWRILVCDLTHVTLLTRRKITRAIHVWHDAFSWVSWPILKYVMTCSCMWLDTRHLLTRRKLRGWYTCDLTRIQMCHDLFSYVT